MFFFSKEKMKHIKIKLYHLLVTESLCDVWVHVKTLLDYYQASHVSWPLSQGRRQKQEF